MTVMMMMVNDSNDVVDDGDENGVTLRTMIILGDNYIDGDGDGGRSDDGG